MCLTESGFKQVLQTGLTVNMGLTNNCMHLITGVYDIAYADQRLVGVLQIICNTVVYY